MEFIRNDENRDTRNIAHLNQQEGAMLEAARLFKLVKPRNFTSESTNLVSNILGTHPISAIHLALAVNRQPSRAIEDLATTLLTNYLQTCPQEERDQIAAAQAKIRNSKDHTRAIKEEIDQFLDTKFKGPVILSNLSFITTMFHFFTGKEIQKSNPANLSMAIYTILEKAKERFTEDASDKMAYVTQNLENIFCDVQITDKSGWFGNTKIETNSAFSTNDIVARLQNSEKLSQTGTILAQNSYQALSVLAEVGRKTEALKQSSADAIAAINETMDELEDGDAMIEAKDVKEILGEAMSNVSKVEQTSSTITQEVGRARGVLTEGVRNNLNQFNQKALGLFNRESGGGDESPSKQGHHWLTSNINRTIA